VVGDGDPGVPREEVAGQLRGEVLDHARRQRGRGQAVARPREQRQREQQDIVRPGVDFDERRFGATLRHVGQVVVRALARARQFVQRCFDRVVVAAGESFVDQFDQATLPELVLDAAAGLGEPAGHLDERGSVG